MLDATRCLSYLTIEVKRSIPDARRADIGAHVYGCDICQEVCPWNAEPAVSSDETWQPHSALDRPGLIDLWRQPDDVLGPIVRRSPMSHTGLRNLRRNLAVALGNSASDDAARALAEPTGDQSKRDPIVAEHVDWARRNVERAT